MSWLGFGKKKKEKPEVVYKIKLDQLAKLGYTDRKKNLEQLKLYAGNVNDVIKDYTVQPKQQPTQQPKPEPKQEPPQKQQPPVQAVQPVIPDQAAPPPLQPEQKQEKQEKQVEPPTNNTQTPEKEQEKEKEKAKEYQGAKISEPKLKAVQPIMPDMATPKTQTQSLTMLFNLRGIVSSDIRQILLNIGEPQIGEIIFSNSIDGDQFYHFIVVNPLLKQFNLSFGDETSYTSLVHQVELSFQKNGAVDIHNTQTTDNKQDKMEETKETKEPPSNEPLKNNIINLISSDVRLLLLPYHVELAERFYAFSLNGNDLSKFDYDGICFATGIKTLSKQNWNTIVTELSLPQSDPFDISKWNKLQQQQEAVIAKADNMQQEMQNLTQKRNKTCTSMHIEKEEKAPPKKTQNLKKQQIKQLNKIILMEKEADKFLPQNFQKLKQRQLTTLTSLHDIASIVDLDENVVNDIQKSARRQSEIDLQNYLKSGTIVLQKQFDEISISPQALEKRQLELLLKINKTRKKLEILANKKGVSLESLNNVKSKVNVDENDVDIVALNKQYGNLFGSLANIAVSVQSTATKYGVELESGEINQHLGPMYDDLERKQNELIARIQYLNDQARMINPKAVEVNEDILHSSV